MTKVAINGFGRIGRLIARAILERPESGLELVSINDLARMDALIHVVRDFEDETVPHPDVTVDPNRDIEKYLGVSRDTVQRYNPALRPPVFQSNKRIPKGYVLRLPAGTAPAGLPVTFTYDPVTHVISDDTPRPLQAERGAHWLSKGVIAWQPPPGTVEMMSTPGANTSTCALP